MSHRPRDYDYMALDDFEELLADKPRDERWELIGGRVVKMMVGARWEYNFIIQNFASGRQSRFRLAGSPCRTLIETFRFGDKSLELSLLPDIIVRCGSLNPGATSIDDPRVLVEVVSTGSEARDRIEKWNVYRNVLSLEHYGLVERDRPAIDVFDRAGDAWSSRRTLAGRDASLDLPKAAVSIPLSEIYQDVLQP